MHTVIIAAYHPFVIQGIIRAVNEKYPESLVKGFTTSAKGFTTLLEKYKPDTVILDVAVTWNSGIDLPDVINRIHPDAEIHFFHVHPLDQKVCEYLDAKMQKNRRIINEPMIDLDQLTFFPSAIIRSD